MRLCVTFESLVPPPEHSQDPAPSLEGGFLTLTLLELHLMSPGIAGIVFGPVAHD
jgi:hypothetical protein